MSGGQRSWEVTYQPTHSPSWEERLYIELQELQAYRQGEQPKTITPPNRMELLSTVVWARLQIVHYHTKSSEHRT